MNNVTAPYKRKLQGYYPPAREIASEPKSVSAHPIKSEIAKNLGTFSFNATFEEDQEAIAAFRNEGLIAYKCILKTADGQRTLGIGHGINVLSAENRYLSKSVKWAHSGAFIAAVTNAVKFPTLDGVPISDFGVGNSEIASAFMATDKQKNYLKELIMSLPEEEGREELLSNLDSLSKEDASELIGQLKN